MSEKDQAAVVPLLFTTVTTGTNLPTLPLILTVKHKEKDTVCLL
jgi:hypothetical protein